MGVRREPGGVLITNSIRTILRNSHVVAVLPRDHNCALLDMLPQSVPLEEQAPPAARPRHRIW